MLNTMNINYYKAKFQVCPLHTGYNNGHDSNVFGFDRLSAAYDFAHLQLAIKDTPMTVWLKDFGTKGSAPCEHTVRRITTIR